MSANTDTPLEPYMELRVKDNVYLIPLKESKQTISLRVLPEAVRVIDKFCALTLNGDVSRTRLIEKTVESVAAAIHSARYRVKAIVVAAVDEENQPHFGTVLFNPSRDELDSIRRRIHALFG